MPFDRRMSPRFIAMFALGLSGCATSGAFHAANLTTVELSSDN